MPEHNQFSSDRRTALRLTGLGLTVGLAGCGGLEGNGDGEVEEDGDGTDTADNGEQTEENENGTELYRLPGIGDQKITKDFVTDPIDTIPVNEDWAGELFTGEGARGYEGWFYFFVYEGRDRILRLDDDQYDRDVLEKYTEETVTGDGGYIENKMGMSGHHIIDGVGLALYASSSMSRVLAVDPNLELEPVQGRYEGGLSDQEVINRANRSLNQKANQISKKSDTKKYQQGGETRTVQIYSDGEINGILAIPDQSNILVKAVNKPFVDGSVDIGLEYNPKNIINRQLNTLFGTGTLSLSQKNDTETNNKTDTIEEKTVQEIKNLRGEGYRDHIAARIFTYNYTREPSDVESYTYRNFNSIDIENDRALSGGINYSDGEGIENPSRDYSVGEGWVSRNDTNLVLRRRSPDGDFVRYYD